MRDKIIKLFTHNVGLKLLAVFFAVLLWLVVVNVDNPSQSKSFTATVSVVNEDVLTAQGKYYTIKDNENTVTFRVTARRSIMEQLNASDFSAIADMSNLENDSRIPVEITANRYSGSVTISGSTKYLPVEIGERMVSKFIINGQATGKPGDGYAVSKVSVSPNVITISGPADEVSRIDSVVAICNIEGLTSDVSESVVPTLLDTMGDVVDTTDLELSETTVNVSVAMQSVKSVAISVETSGELGEGLILKDLTTDPGSIQIMGDGSVINDITKVTIPGTVIDLSKITESMETSVDIATYLPEGVSLVGDSAAKVVISVKVDQIISEELELSTSNLSFENKQNGFSYEFVNDTFVATITGASEEIEKIKTSTIKGKVDVEGLTEGTHEVPVVLNIDEETFEAEAENVEVLIASKTAAVGTEE